jgi:aryl-alcohol dehydrogenase-like predicted oxidoreductase
MAKRKGAIPMAKNAEQAEENVGALGWALADADVGRKGGHPAGS